jgi:acyl-coenzyme A thioesterase PaaI-like protein
MAIAKMAVNEKGLVHGGFILGLADHAAMLAVNHPDVVLGGAECNFLAPVKGGLMRARVVVTNVNGRKREVGLRSWCLIV